jgi:hypothetical protein
MRQQEKAFYQKTILLTIIFKKLLTFPLRIVIFLFITIRITLDVCCIFYSTDLKNLHTEFQFPIGRSLASASGGDAATKKLEVLSSGLENIV